MWRRLRISWAVGVLVSGLGSAWAFAQQPPPLRDPVTLADEHARITRAVRRIHGIVEMTSLPSTIPGTQFFRILFLQPIDHDRPERGTFTQRATLLHRSSAAPMVLVLSGYDLGGSTPFQGELTGLLQANQLFVEHRFFSASTPPAPVDWADLTIAQSAADHHAIVAAFKSVYVGRWISTGRSKGGMASVYHRFFYPDDVDATVAYVAPSTHGISDGRYLPFLDLVGSESCRQALVDLQRAALARRAELVPLLVPAQDFVLFPPDKALEAAVLDLPFVYWQYGSTHPPCGSIPAPSATAGQIFQFLDDVVILAFYSDPILNAFAAYFYQAATEIGYPDIDERRVGDLLRYPGQVGVDAYPPRGVEKAFHPEVAPTIEAWVLDHGLRFLFLDGASDPWSATPFTVSAANDSYRYVVTGPRGDHTAVIADLGEPDRSAALAKLGQWMGVPIAATAAARAESNPDVELSDPRHRFRRLAEAMIVD